MGQAVLHYGGRFEVCVNLQIDVNKYINLKVFLWNSRKEKARANPSQQGLITYLSHNFCKSGSYKTPLYVY